MLKTFFAFVVLASLQANADFSKSQAEARAYRESGQLARDNERRREENRIAYIPTGNKLYLEDVARFAKRFGGFKTGQKISYDSEGSVIGVEFLTRANLECRAAYADLNCVDLLTKTEYYYMPQTPSGWGTAGLPVGR